jgi:AraC family ethanolamine operon transcriptional activator
LSIGGSRTVQAVQASERLGVDDRGMTRSITSVLHQYDDFQNALKDAGDLSIVITGPGSLQVRLIKLALKNVRIISVQENLPRIAFIRVPDDTILLTFPISSHSAPVWGGIPCGADGFITVRGGESLHMRTEGSVYWCAVWFPAVVFHRFRRALTGKPADLPGPVCAWRPPASARGALLRLITSAVRTAHTEWVALTVDQAAHGLEQQIIHSCIECMEGAPFIQETPATRRHRDLVTRFEALLQTNEEADVRMSDLSGPLEVSERELRRSCQHQLGMSPMNYLRLHRMQLAHRALRHGMVEPVRVADLAVRYGFRNPGRFASAYRKLFGELPSSTLRRGVPRLRRAGPAKVGSERNSGRTTD